MTLDQVDIGGKAVITAVHLEGAERRRIFDLGLSIGTIVEAVRRSPLGDPVAYRVRGSMIALRKEQASRIEVEIG